jgi:hypothetical protein
VPGGDRGGISVPSAGVARGVPGVAPDAALSVEGVRRPPVGVDYGSLPQGC